GFRAEVCREMEALGLSFVEEKNKAASRQDAKFSAEGSKVEAWVIPTYEELMIARDTLELIEK
ncbi:acetate kinase, partial [Bittarella massiliensis]|nr:acetate kinase [Bittarella massiliensis (ex Durand et al. 2017)]